MILTKEYRLVWDNEIILYGQFNLDTQTETDKNAYDCDTQEELDDKVIALGFEIPADLPCVYGCTNPASQNYEPLATCDDGSCILPPRPPELE